MRGSVSAVQATAQLPGRVRARRPLLLLTPLLAAACSYLDEAGPRQAAVIPDSAQPTAAAGFAGAPAPTTAMQMPGIGAVDAPPEPALDVMPELLSQTGLYSNVTNRTLGADVQLFSPSYPLWSDAAGKNRWIRLPAGAQIDTSDMDVWKLPIGTKLWKEFEQNGHAIETRYMAKYGPTEQDWLFIAYQWNAEQTEASAVPQGVENAAGGSHDIPSVATCKQCHNSAPMAALGFSALQLAHGGPGLTLDTLTAAGQLSAPPATALAIPGDPVSVQALGYLHGNCGGCHNDRATQNFGVAETKIVFWQSAQQLSSLEQTSTYVNLVTNTRGDLTRLVHGLNRMKMRDRFTQMPPLGTEVVDAQGVALVESWVNQLQTQLGSRTP
ncbi:MAG TPA: hypothetical protein VFN67_30695 [Polyangiales bacterium]|nr:hypothetical protein [Polyangiales bacterium]